MTRLCQCLGIQFDPASNFYGKLIISDPSSIAVLRAANVIVEKPTEIPTLSPPSSRFFDLTGAKPAGKIDWAALETAEKELKAEIDALKAEMGRLRAELKLLHPEPEALALRHKKDMIERVIYDKNDMHRQLLAFVNGLVTIPGNKILQLPNGIEPQPALESFYKLRELMHTQFQYAPSCEWNLMTTNKILAITLGFDEWTGKIQPEAVEVSRFLHALGSPPSNAEHCIRHELTQQQLDNAIKALLVFRKKTPEEVEAIRSRPAASC